MKESSKSKGSSQNQTEQVNNDIDIFLTFGDNTNEKKLIEIDLKFNVGIISFPLSSYMINRKNARQNDLFLMIKFYVTPGREKQAAEYLQRGMDQQQQQQCLNPIQSYLRKPKSAGRVYFQEEQGLVIVYYCIYEQYAVREEAIKQLLQSIKSDEHRPKIDFNFFMRGQECTGVKDRTVIYPDYCQLNLKVSNLSFEKVGIVLKQMDLIPPQLIEFPLYKMMTSGLRKVRLKSNLSTFKKLTNMYKQLAAIDRQNRQPDPYIHKNLLRNKIQILMSWGNLGVAQVQIKFQVEDHIHWIAQRILKVYQQA